MSKRSRRVEVVLFILVLVVGASLRLAALDVAPPGLTHDEADHGLSAAGVLEGDRPIYFTVGYGREPLYDYVTAVVMLLAGKHFMASRLTAAFFGIGLLVLTYGWVRLATQNRWLALATMAGLAVSFWGIATSRQALRSITLPVLYMSAALAMRRGIRVEEDVEDDFVLSTYRPQAEIERWAWFVLAGVFLGLTFYTYMAARVMWVVFPAFFVFLSVSQHGVIRRVWPGLLVMLVVGMAVAVPLFVYLRAHPGAEVRIDELFSPVDALLGGDPGPLLRNVRAGLGMITISGDDLWLYNIPGRPLLRRVMSLFFYLGISVATISVVSPYRPAQRGRRSYDDAFRISSSNAFMLLTLVVGLVPALVTGVSASSPRVVGLLPALYYFPALAVTWMADWANRRVGRSGALALWTAFGVLAAITGGLSAHDYFTVWNQARDVRVAYHTTLVESLRYLDDHSEIGPYVAMSSIYPGEAHDPAIAEIVLVRDDLRISWFDGRSALVLPDARPLESITYFFPRIARLDPALTPVLSGEHIASRDRIKLRPDDFNRNVDVITWQYAPVMPGLGDEVLAGDVLELYDWLVAPDGRVRPGDTLEVLTWWVIRQSTDRELVLFTHVLDGSGRLIAQQDLLGVPSSSWLVGDRFVQLHRVVIPAYTSPGMVRVVVGVYTEPDVTRLPLATGDGVAIGDHHVIGEVEIVAR